MPLARSSEGLRGDLALGRDGSSCIVVFVAVMKNSCDIHTRYFIRRSSARLEVLLASTRRPLEFGRVGEILARKIDCCQ